VLEGVVLKEVLLVFGVRWVEAHALMWHIHFAVHSLLPLPIDTVEQESNNPDTEKETAEYPQ